MKSFEDGTTRSFPVPVKPPWTRPSRPYSVQETQVGKPMEDGQSL